jgi:hypothetical protein
MSITRRGFPIRWSRTIWCSFALLLALLLPVSAALAAGEMTGTLVGADHTRGQDVRFTVNKNGTPTVVTDFAGVLLVDLATPVQQRVGMFCIEATVATRAGTNYQNNGSIIDRPNGKQIVYLLSTYPASGIGSTVEGAAVQLAIWHFTDGVNLNTIVDANADVRTRAITLVNEANAAPDRAIRTAPLSLAINPPTAVVPVGQTQTFTIAAGASGSGLTANYTISGPAQLAGGGQQGSVVLGPNGNGVVDVTVTGLGAVSINASLSYTVDGGTIFQSVGVVRQELVLAQAVPLTASASATIEPAQVTETPTGTVPVETPTATPTGVVETPTATPTGTVPVGTPTATPTGVAETPTATPTDDISTATPTGVTRTPDLVPTLTETPTTVEQTATPTRPGDDDCCDSTETPTGTGETPTGTGETPTAGGETPTGTGETPTAVEGQPNLTPGAPAGGVPRSGQPGRLPVTGEQPSPGRGIGLLLAAVLVIAGLALRRWMPEEARRTNTGNTHDGE